MGVNHSFICSHRLSHFTACLLFLSILSSTHFSLMAEGRAMPIPEHKKSISDEMVNEEEKAIVRARIGSRPPRCERRCNSCGHCEAIQVPTNPQVKSGTTKQSSLLSNVQYARGQDNSNYKPMSWKCKCGDFIFNP
ncbi:hypothetical protein L484_007764 [Morus notabilis]|uniref:Epidermal patterning factor-like protein n=1 Tax=Morus notabilis TaxID=981085 RepID=W9R9T3_9ROSA|nr:EPIDERMAL PATTERNING FACTOR-like protein 2 [Morus notabilis]EXB78246.1 hypothetical protein L484_007764 [Morus notabilis]